MLELRNIKKEYKMGDEIVHALKGVDLTFGENEFVAILGQSGCGKTTLLNIVGGLDRYTSGDLVINGVSTKKYKSKDWDTYRNNSIGFVFQSYQLIPHQTVLANVELTMTLSGISKKERRRRATEALRKVGLGDQLKKKPNQMSGGQMQRAAIARALVNNPDIILADEPTGALDTETSVQIMNILKEVSRDHLVIMVTHNPELAEEYATRIVRLQDGLVISDNEKNSAAAGSVEIVGSKLSESHQAPKTRGKKEKTKTAKKKSMSPMTAFSLSLNNLMTKKGRTFLTAFAGAIGIIGIALILAASTGIQRYIDSVESDTLSQYPLTVNRESVDISEIMQSMISGQQKEFEEEQQEDIVWSNNMMADMILNIANERTENDMRAFRKFVEEDETLKKYLRAVEYGYSTTLNVYNTNADTDSGILRVNPATVMDKMGMNRGQSSGQGLGGGGMRSVIGSSNVWSQLPSNREMMEQSYELLDGRYPENYDEILVAVTENGKIGDYTLYALGIYDQEELKEMMQKAMRGEEVEKHEKTSYTYEDLKSMSFSVLPNYAYYEKQENGTYEDMSEDEKYIRETLKTEGIDLKIVGVVKLTGNGSELGVYGGVLYQPSLMLELLKRIDRSEIVTTQKEKPETDVFTGIDFPRDDDTQEPLTMEKVNERIAELPPESQGAMKAMIAGMQAQGYTEKEILAQLEPIFNLKTDATYDGNLKLLGVQEEDNPSTVRLFPTDFETKEKVVDILDEYSASLSEGRELKYTDYVGILMSSVTTIINVITYVLIGFVAVSLIVSSIMIGIITYISVMERTREIGILRSIGASKQDIARVFNAETLLIGFVSGLIGIAIPYLVSIFVNAIVLEYFDIANIMYLSPAAAVILVIISMLLTLIGGFIPSRIAAKKDPVEALRTE